ACEYLRADQVGAFDLMLSFTGEPTLTILESAYGARRALPLYCSVDVDAYGPRDCRKDIDLGYMGTYSADRQPGVEMLLNEPARRLSECRFMVVGAQYPSALQWPDNVRRADHLPPNAHAEFYGRQRWTLNITRADMRAAGHSPSVRLFEAAACGTPIISDVWPGIEDVLEPHEELMIARTSEDVVRLLREVAPYEAQRIARAARARVLSAHSSERRADELIAYLHGAHRGAGSPDEARKVASACGNARGAKMSTSSSDAIRSEIEALGPWFHNLHLPGGVQTAPGHQYGDFPRFKWEQLAHAIPKDLSG